MLFTSYAKNIKNIIYSNGQLKNNLNTLKVMCIFHK